MLGGGCLCGAVRYEIEGEPIMAGHCHCLDCQKASGAGHASHAMFPEGALMLTGMLSEYSRLADSDATVTRYFCPICGSGIYARSSGMPGVITVNVGALDEPGRILMQMRVYDRSRRAWDAIDPGLPAFEATPPMQQQPPAAAE